MTTGPSSLALYMVNILEYEICNAMPSHRCGDDGSILTLLVVVRVVFPKGVLTLPVVRIVIPKLTLAICIIQVNIPFVVISASIRAPYIRVRSVALRIAYLGV